MYANKKRDASLHTKTPTSNIEIINLPGVGKQIAKHLSRLDIYYIEDLLFHLPHRYQDRTRIQPINKVIIDQEAVIEGVIKSVSPGKKGRTKLLCELQDETGTITLRFFHVLAFHKSILKTGTRLRCYGEIKFGPNGKELFHPEFQVITPGKPLPIEQSYTPIYPATEGVSQYTLRKLTLSALSWMSNETAFQELLPSSLLQTLGFPSFQEALYFVHRPPSQTDLTHLSEIRTQAQQRLTFEELLAHRMSLLHIKHIFQSQSGLSLIATDSLIKPFRQQLSFQLTKAQERVSQEIREDLMRTRPMLRLVQGDVGSGKTVIAAFAMLQAVENGYQAALMAPTELLAEQHARVFKKWLKPLGVSVVLLTGSVKGGARTAALKAIANGEIQIILGTHALFQEEVHFSRLALVVVDEQHRFGVHQRALFKEKGSQDYIPHQLIMTATPIPRTLAMSFYADLDASIIDELPAGRTPIMTTVIASARRHEVVARIQKACDEGRQVYWVCPLIDESEAIACQAATAAFEELKHLLPEFKIALIHGRMKAADKELTMNAFQAGEVHILVATTVIEVGVDVANASVMVIENAERLGLSQLHQLRGRVGRGTVASYCVLLYQYPLSDLAKERLKVMRETTDGFAIAERDLALRGPGEVLGTRQTGAILFRIADLLRDNMMLDEVQKTADFILNSHLELIEPLMRRWLGKGEKYGKV